MIEVAARPYPPTPILRVRIRLAAGGWVMVCFANAERLAKDGHTEVQMKTFRHRVWEPFGGEHTTRCLYRARNLS